MTEVLRPAFTKGNEGADALRHLADQIESGEIKEFVSLWILEDGNARWVCGVINPFTVLGVMSICAAQLREDYTAPSYEGSDT